MSLQKKYFYYFRDLDNLQYTAEIWEETAGTITAAEIRGDASPFTVTMPAITDKFQPVRGTGCQINLVSQTNMQFLGLYTANMQQYQIRLYASGSLVWIGWLDSELYSEPFNELTNYPVSFSGSDGFAILDRMNYINDDGSKITGISSQINVLKFILGKMNLPFAGLSIYLSTTATGTTPTAEETLLHVSHVMNANYYNEDGDPETLRTVLESILRPYGAFITQVNGTLFITDVHTIAAGTSVTAKRYNSLTLEYVDTVTFNPNKGDVSTIGFTSEAQTLDIVSGVNKQIVSFSPYGNIDIIDYDAENDNFSTVNAVEAKGSGSYAWSETFYDTSDSFNRTALKGFFCKLNGTVAGLNDTEEDYYLKNIVEVDNVYNGSPSGVFTPGDQTFAFKGQLPTMVNASGGYSIKVEMSVYPVTKADLNNPAEAGTEIGFLNLYTDLIIGGKKYNWHVATNTPTVTNGWKLLADYGHLDLPFYTPITNLAPYANIADVWTTLQRKRTIYKSPTDYLLSNYDFLVPLDSGVAGDVQFKIYGFDAYDLGFGDATNFYNLRIKDIKLTIVDAQGNDVSNIDIEYVGYLNAQFKEEGANIDLLQGTNTTNFPTCRGGLLSFDGTDYSFIQSWTRASVTDIIENLLLRSYVGNYEGKTKQITCSVNLLQNTVGYLTYANYLTGKFMLTSFTQDFEQASTELTMQEIFTDSLTINKTF